jgi:hypothetical protein
VEGEIGFGSRSDRSQKENYRFFIDSIDQKEKKTIARSLALGDGDSLPFTDRELIASGRIDRAPGDFSLAGQPT